MSRQPSIPQSDAFRAITALVSQGIRPTNARVREAFDGRGSPVVLERYITEWFERFGQQLGEKAGSVAAAPVDGDVRKHLESAAQAALREVDREMAKRTQALDERSKGLDHLHEQLSRREAELEQRERGLQETMDDLRQRATAADERRGAAVLAASQVGETLAATKAERDALREALATARAERDGLATRLAVVRTRHAEAQAGVGTLAGQIERLQADLDAAEERSRVAGAALEAIRGQLEASHATARRELLELTERHIAQQDRAAQDHQRALSAAHEAAAQARIAQTSLQEQLAAARAEVAAATEQRREILASLAAEREQLAASRRDADTLRARHAELDTARTKLDARVAALLDAIPALAKTQETKRP